MLSKRSLIVTLVGLNLFLLAALIFKTSAPSSAYAQIAGRPGDFTVMSGRIHSNYDAVYVIDHAAKILHAFLPNENETGQVRYVASVDLANDFNPRR